MSFFFNIKLKTLLWYTLILILVISNFDFFSNDFIRKGILYILFIGFVIYYLFLNHMTIPKSIVQIAVCSIVIIFYVGIVKGYPLLHDRIIYVVLDVGMIWLGFNVKKNEGEYSVNRILKFYIYVCSFSCIYYLFNFDTSIVYGYDLKHCLAGNILISSIILLLNKVKLNKKLRAILFILHLYTVLNLNSRSTIVSLLISFFVFLYLRRKSVLSYFNTRIRILSLVLSVPFLFLFLFILIDQISDALRLDFLHNHSIVEYSSDRIPMIISGIKYVKQNLLLGVGNTGLVSDGFYVECFPIDILVQLGIIGVVLYSTWFYIICKHIFTSSLVVQGNDLAIVCFVAIFVLGFFQATAPMGPGTAYSFAWIIVGICWRYNDRINIMNRYVAE